MHRFYLENPSISQNVVEIRDGRITFQMSKVLRMRTGDEFSFFGKDTKEYKAKVLEIDRKKVIASIVEPIQSKTESSLNISLFQAIPKKPALFELVVQKATELGVTAIFPLITERTEGRRMLKFERLMTIATEAAEQCGRVTVPTIHHPIKFSDVLKKPNTYLAYELENTKNLQDFLPAIDKADEANIVIGPEGGLSNAEVAEAKKAKVPTFSLGKRILRTETAAITALGCLLSRD